jgi:hypothetical protein
MNVKGTDPVDSLTARHALASEALTGILAGAGARGVAPTRESLARAVAAAYFAADAMIARGNGAAMPGEEPPDRRLVLVETMRAAQNAYRKTRDPSKQEEAAQLELAVDAMLGAWREGPLLFDERGGA